MASVWEPRDSEIRIIHTLDLLYMATINWLSLVKMVEIPLWTFNIFHADFVPLPRKADAALYPVNAWINRSPLAYSGLIVFTTLCTGIHRKFPPWPNAIHIFYWPSSFKDFMTDMAMIGISKKAFPILRGLAGWCNPSSYPHWTPYTHQAQCQLFVIGRKRSNSRRMSSLA